MYGLVLEGGGARGSYHMGAYKAILEEGLEIGGVAGTSIGALNGAMIVQGDYERCYDLWHDINYSMLFNELDLEIERTRGLKYDKEDLIHLAEKIKSIISDGGLDITSLKQLMDEYIDEERIRESNKDFGVVTVNLTDFKPIEIFIEDIPKGELKNYLLASSYLPVFKPEKIGGKRFLDGGFYDNMPFKLLMTKGYKDLIIVRTHSKGLTRRINREINPIVISPSDDIGRTFTLDNELIRRNINLGYYDGLKAIRGLKGRVYYIESHKDGDFFTDLLLKLTDEQISNIRQHMRVPQIPEKRVLLEYIIPKTASAMGLNKEFTYEDFVISLLERKAEALNIERFKIYTFEELLDLVRCNPLKEEQQEDVEPTIIDKIIEKVDIALLFNKEEIIQNVADIILCCK